MDFRKTVFVRSAASPAGFPADGAKRLVFAGRSNVGKSSTINRIVGKKGFARVSSMPGKTVHVNLFSTEGRIWLVDLPGYGYSKTSMAERERYSKLIEEYFAYDMKNIARLYVIVDIRHKPTEGDIAMIKWAQNYDLPITVVANKSDKIKKSEIEPSLKLIRQTLELGDILIIPFSAEKGDGRDALVKDMLEA